MATIEAPHAHTEQEVIEGGSRKLLACLRAIVEEQKLLNDQIEGRSLTATETLKSVKNLYDSLSAMRKEVLDYTTKELELLHRHKLEVRATAQHVPNAELALSSLDHVEYVKNELARAPGPVEQTVQHTSMIGTGIAMGSAFGTGVGMAGALGSFALNNILDAKIENPKTRTAVKLGVNGALLGGAAAVGIATGTWPVLLTSAGVSLVTGWVFRKVAQATARSEERSAQEPAMASA